MKRLVLIADSRGLIIARYNEVLLRRGLMVETARDGMECMAKLRQLQPDVLLLHSHLLWGGSEGVLGILEQDPGLRHVSALVLGNYKGHTGTGGSRCIKGRFSGPPLPHQLLDSIQKCLRRSKPALHRRLASQKQPEEIRPGIARIPQRKKTALLIEDDRVNYKLLKDILEIKFEVSGVGSAEEALTLLEDQEHPDLIFLDLLLPQMSGFEFLEKARNNLSTRDIPIVVVSALAFDHDIQKARDLGCAEYVTKPLTEDPLQFVERMEELLQSESSDSLNGMNQRPESTVFGGKG